MMRRGGGPRGRHPINYSPRMDEKGGHSARGEASPSRHLWVGNLSPRMTQSILFEHFLRFGDLESIAFIPGRSYAFVNYMKEEDAVLALRALKGSVVAGTALRIEFQKGDKSSYSAHDAEQVQTREERYPVERGESFSQRDLRSRRASPENTRGDRNAEPSEVLWIGFPAFLNVDEEVLGRSFSPFGEIEKITTFPGRSYAFVRYRSVVAACRAKEALQGKLFGNPRVSICFAKSDVGPHEIGYSSRPSSKSSFQPGLSVRGNDTSHFDRNIGSPVGEFSMASSRFFRDMENMPRDAGLVGFGRSNSAGLGAGPGSNVSGVFDDTRFQGLGPERRIPEDPFDRYRDSPLVERGTIRHDIRPERLRRGSHFDDLWNMEDSDFPLPKKARVDMFPDKELPEYPFSDFDREKEHDRRHKLFTDSEEHQMNSRTLDSMSKGLSDYSRNSAQPQESDDYWRTSDSYDARPGPMLLNPSKSQRHSPDSHQFINEVWKWEGTIAKGGTPICRARCFPVGKVLDMMLPQFLDCTARTGLDMLAKHFYQASNSWVVFFVPETDADISYYNEFMHYLGEKQRAAVAKLGEKTTLFLVPPSDFSEQVLKVPGKVSISGVILKFQQANSSFSTSHHPLSGLESKLPLYNDRAPNRMDTRGDLSQRKHILPEFRLNDFNSSSEQVTSSSAILALNIPTEISSYAKSHLPVEKMPMEGRYDHFQQRSSSVQPSNWPSQGARFPDAGSGESSPPTNITSQSADNSTRQEFPYTNPTIEGVSKSSSHFVPGFSGSTSHVSSKFANPQEAKPAVPPSAPSPSIQPEQLAHLTALLEQQKRMGKEPVLASGDQRQPKFTVKPDSQLLASSLLQTGQVQQVQQVQQYPSNATALPATATQQTNSNQPVQSSAQEETEADPQKRLQATLQLAAALLQQIQQQTKSVKQ